MLNGDYHYYMNNEDTENLIGILTATNSGLSLGEDDKSTSLHALIQPEKRSVFRLGQYVIIPFPSNKKDEEETLFCKIKTISYTSDIPHNFGSYDLANNYAQDLINWDDNNDLSDDFKSIAELVPLSILCKKQTGSGLHERRTPDRLPHPKTRVYSILDSQIIKSGLKIPIGHEHIFVGYVSDSRGPIGNTPDSFIDYRIKDKLSPKEDPLIFKHFLVAGGTGSGKTHTAKNILLQYLETSREYFINGKTKNLSIVQFDPQNEYAQMAHSNKNLTKEAIGICTLQNISYGGHKDTKIFVPTLGDSNYVSCSIDEDEKGVDEQAFSIPFSLVRENAGLLARSELNEVQATGLVDVLIPEFFKKHPEGTYNEFIGFLENPETFNEFSSSDSGKIFPATFHAITRKVRGFNSIFDNSNAQPITELIEEFVQPGRLSIVPTSHINNFRDQEVLVLAISSLLINAKLAGKDSEDAPSIYSSIKETPLLISIDEAHNFLSSAETEQGNQIIEKFISAAKQGRKELLGLFLITQDPTDISPAILKQLNTKIILNLSDSNIIKSLNMPNELSRKIPHLSTGQMVVHSPSNSEPVQLTGLSECLTKHSGMR